MEKGSYALLKVLDRKTKKPIWIKEYRFSSTYHIKIAGEKPISKSHFRSLHNIHERKTITVDPLQAAVERGQIAKEQEEANVGVGEEEVVDPKDIPGYEATPEAPGADQSEDQATGTQEADAGKAKPADLGMAALEEATVAEIQDMLRTSNISFKASMNKAELIELFLNGESSNS